MDNDRIKDRIRKLMALANDGGATDGEIDNAMRFAARLMDEHHIAADDLAQPTADDAAMPALGRTFATSTAERLTTWESTLGAAICALVGSVKWYRTHETQPIRVNGIAATDGRGNARKGTRVCFYGPATDAQEAAELFAEWARLIATMGVVRWGGCYRGDGAQYCYGFACALHETAKRIDEERRAVLAMPIALLPSGTATAGLPIVFSGTIGVRQRHEIIKNAAGEWLGDCLWHSTGLIGARRRISANRIKRVQRWAARRLTRRIRPRFTSQDDRLINPPARGLPASRWLSARIPWASNPNREVKT